MLPIGLVPAFTSKPSYEAVSKIALEKPPDVVTFGRSFTPDDYFRDRQHPLASTTAVILSDRVLGLVVDQVPEGEPIEPGLMTKAKMKVRVWLGMSAEDDEMSPTLKRHLRIERLRENTKVMDAGGASILAITVEDREARRAAFLANAIADSFVEYDRDRRRSASRMAQSWLTQKQNELRDKIRRQQEAMDEIVKKLGGRRPRTASDPLLEGERQELMKTLEEANYELLSVEHRLAELEPRVKKFELAADEAQAATGSALREYYMELKRQLAEAESTLTPTHPRLQRLRESVAEVEAKLDAAPATLTVDPLLVESVKEFERLRSDRAVILARVESLTRTLDSLLGAGLEHSTETANYQRLEREAEMDLEMLREIQTRLSATLLSAAKDQALARVLDYAVLPTKTSGGRRKLLVLGVGAAFALGVGMALLGELLDRAEHDSTQAASTLGVQILASVPLAEPELMKKARAALEYTTPVGEAFRRLRTSLIYSGVGGEIRTLVIASAVAGEGKTTVSTNLAASFAQTGRRVLLIDSDMRRPRVNEVIGLPRGPGLSEVLRGRAKPSEVIHSPKMYSADVMTSGEIPDNPTDLLSHTLMPEMLEQLQTEYDLVIVDAPVLLAVSDALLVGAYAHGVLVVNKPGAVERNAFKTMATELRRVGARVIGLVANQVKEGDTYTYPSYLQSPYVGSKKGFFRRRWASRGA